METPIALLRLWFKNVMGVSVISDFFDYSIACHLTQQSSHAAIAKPDDVDKITYFRLTVFFKKRYDNAFSIGRLNRLATDLRPIEASSSFLFNVTLKKPVNSNSGSATFAFRVAFFIRLIPVPICSI